MAAHQKYSKLGLVTPASMIGVELGIANILCGMANFGLSANTWKSYECIINNLARCEEATGKDMQCDDRERVEGFLYECIYLSSQNVPSGHGIQ